MPTPHQTDCVEFIEEITMNIDPRSQLEAKRDALIAENQALKANSPEGMRERERKLIAREDAVEEHYRLASPAADIERAIFQQVAGGRHGR